LRGCVRPWGRICPRSRARGAEFHANAPAAQRNSLYAQGVESSVMLTSAIVFGMVGVAAGFTWDYVINRGK